MSIEMLAQTTGTDLSENLLNAVMLTLVGMLVVFVSLMLLLAAITLLNRLGAEKPQSQPEAEPAPAPEAAAAETATQVTDPHLIAVLTAAATAALRRRVRVRRAHFVQTGNHTWAQLGRHEIMSSHRPHLHREQRR